MVKQIAEVRRINANIPEAFGFLFQKARYKVAHGGRGGAKSWAFADALLLTGMQSPIRILCAREIMNSLKESVLRLLIDRIRALGLTDFYTDTATGITGINGTTFLFAGLFRNVNQIKSLENIKIVWVEEAESVSKESWDMLIPTIRAEDSEIWVSFNPQFEDDDTYQRFVVNPPDGAIVKQINYDQNPYFPEVLRKEMEQDKARDKQKYENVWLGKPNGSGRRIWTAFDRVDHVREFPMDEIAKHGRCFMSMDPHSKYYPFCTWTALIPKNARKKWPEDFYKHVYAEWPTYEDLNGFYHDLRHKAMYTGTIGDMAREIQVKDGAAYGIQIKARYIDTRYAKGAGGSNWSTSTEGVVAQFAKRENGGLLFQMPPERRIDVQREIIHGDMLYNKTMPRSQFNEPTFSVSPLCKNVIASLSNHRLEDDSERESEKYKDPSDALRINWAGFMSVGYDDLRESPGPTPVQAGRGFW